MLEVNELILEFLECSIHSILKTRCVYPPELFEKSVKYGVSCWRCRHPEVNEYISRVLSNARPLLSEVLYLNCNLDVSDHSFAEIIRKSSNGDNFIWGGSNRPLRVSYLRPSGDVSQLPLYRLHGG